jgi:hypothetical protein
VWRTVREGGHAFRVNLGGYVDTGLFLDHRITRAKAAAEPAKTMLNLFAYTGSFSVYCAAAGMQTTTVDLSKTYLEWAGENLAPAKEGGTAGNGLRRASSLRQDRNVTKDRSDRDPHRRRRHYRREPRPRSAG